MMNTQKSSSNLNENSFNPSVMKAVHDENLNNEKSSKGLRENDNASDIVLNDTANISLGTVNDIPLEVSVTISRISMPIREFVGIRAGSLLKLDKKISDLIEISVNNRAVALGELIIKDGELYIKIIKMV